MDIYFGDVNKGNNDQTPTAEEKAKNKFMRKSSADKFSQLYDESVELMDKTESLTPVMYDLVVDAANNTAHFNSDKNVSEITQEIFEKIYKKEPVIINAVLMDFVGDDEYHNYLYIQCHTANVMYDVLQEKDKLNVRLFNLIFDGHAYNSPGSEVQTDLYLVHLMYNGDNDSSYKLYIIENDVTTVYNIE